MSAPATSSPPFSSNAPASGPDQPTSGDPGALSHNNPQPPDKLDCMPDDLAALPQDKPTHAITGDTGSTAHPAPPTNMERADTSRLCDLDKANNDSQQSKVDSGKGGASEVKYQTLGTGSEVEILRQADEHIRRFLQSKATELAANMSTPEGAAAADTKGFTYSGAAASHLTQLAQTEENIQAEKEASSASRGQDIEPMHQGVKADALMQLGGGHGIGLQDPVPHTVDDNTSLGGHIKSYADKHPTSFPPGSEVAPSSLLTSSTYGRMHGELDATLDGIFTKYPVAKVPDDPKSSKWMKMKSVNNQSDHGFIQGAMAADYGLPIKSSEVNYLQMALSPKVPSIWEEATRLRNNMPGGTAQNDFKGQNVFQQHIQGLESTSLNAQATTYLLPRTNLYAQYPTQPTSLPLRPASGTMIGSSTMQPPAPEFVQDIHDRDDQLYSSPMRRDEISGQSLDGHSVAEASSRKAARRIQIHTKRKAADALSDDDDEDSEWQEHSSDTDSEGDSETVRAKSDSYEPPPGSSDDSDSEENLPLMIRRPIPYGNSQYGGRPANVSQSSYHGEDEGEDDSDEEKGIQAKYEHDNDVYEDSKQAQESSSRLMVELPLSTTSDRAPFGKCGVNPTDEETNNLSLEKNTAPTGSLELQGEFTPEPETGRLGEFSWKLPQYLVEILPTNSKDDEPKVSVNLPNMPREVLVLTPDHAHQEIHLLQNLFIPGQQALPEPDPWPMQALLNFHTVSTMVLEAYTSYEIGDVHTKDSVAPRNDENKDISALDASKDEIFFAVMDRWRVGLAEGTRKPAYELIRGAQEFCDIALDVIHYLDENGFIEERQKVPKERADQGKKMIKTKGDYEKEDKVLVKKGIGAKKAFADEDSPKKRGRPKKEDSESPVKSKDKEAGKIHRPPVKKKVKTAPTPAPKPKKGPTVSVIKKGKNDK